MLDEEKTEAQIDKEVLNRSLLEPYASALRISSPSLYASMSSDGLSPKSSARRSSSLYRFLARASTRSTPYGAFAGVGLAKIGTQTSLIRADGMRLFARPDTSWLIAVSEALTSVASPSSSTLIANPQLLIHGGRVTLPYADTKGTADDRRVDVRLTEAVEAVLSACDGVRGIHEVTEEVLQQHPNYPRDSVDELLSTLVELNIISPASLIRVGSNEPDRLLQEFAAEVKESHPIAEVTASLRKISRLTCETGEKLRSIEEAQSYISPGKPGETIQIDGSLELNDAVISEKTVLKIRDAVEVLSRIAPSQRSPHLEEFHSRCVERYGIYAEVPLKELISEESGVGPPNDYIMPSPKAWHPLAPSPPPTDWQKVSTRLTAEALMDGSTSIDLRAALKLMPEVDQARSLVPSLDVYASLIAPNTESTEKWCAALAAEGITEGGRTFGRFLHQLPDNATLALRDLYQHAYPADDFLLAEIRYLPTSGRAANVTTVPSLTEAEIVVNLAPSDPDVSVVDLDDVLVYLANDRFAFRLRGDSREMKAVQSHMLNPQMAPNPLRFLIEATQEASGILPYLDTSHLGSLSYVPRFIVDDVIVRASRWVVRAEDKVFDTAQTFEAWRERFRVARYIYVTEADNRLLVDLDSPIARRELARVLEQKVESDSSVILEECIPQPDEMSLSDLRGSSYAHELVIPFLNSSYKPQKLITDAIARQSIERMGHGSVAERAYGPGSDWTSIKAYAPFERHDDILREIVGPTLSTLDIPWFYVEYADPYPHLRVRARTSMDGRSATSLTNAFEKARLNGIISRFEIGTYDREIERYGGAQTIEWAENLFYASSQFSIKAIELSHKRKIDREWLTVLALEIIASPWESGSILDLSGEPTIAPGTRKEFYRISRSLTEMLSYWRGDSLAEEIRAKLAIEVEHLQRSSHSFHDEVTRRLANVELMSDPTNIMASVLHMQCNRLLVGDRTDEKKVMHLWHLARNAIAKRPLKVDSL
ncbi:lantibiotic dehydratase [Arthrobacter sp. LS16]|uniref:lantibiotic dehydratase n=1 Tax=Arthrobacter sp. 'calajunan' TaxID=1690248 RepID=UPI003C772F5D